MRYQIACFVLALLGTLSPAFAFDESHVSKLYALKECVSCDLGLADFQSLDLSYENLIGATLQGADLNYYEPSRKVLSNANSAGSVSRNANLATAVLSGANLTDEGIRDAILQGVLLRNGNLIGAVLSRVNLTDANIRGVALKNLEHQYDLLQHQD